jgi:hypothetical protein
VGGTDILGNNEGFPTGAAMNERGHLTEVSIFNGRNSDERMGRCATVTLQKKGFRGNLGWTRHGKEGRTLVATEAISIMGSAGIQNEQIPRGESDEIKGGRPGRFQDATLQPRRTRVNDPHQAMQTHPSSRFVWCVYVYR